MNELKITELSIHELDTSKSEDDMNSDSIISDVTSDSIQSESKNLTFIQNTTAHHQTINQFNITDQQLSKWLEKSGSTTTESADSESLISEVYDTDVSSITDSDIHQAIDPRFALQKKFKVEELLQENGSNTFVDTSGNIFKNINVDRSEKVYVGNVTNINIYKVKKVSDTRKEEKLNNNKEETTAKNESETVEKSVYAEEHVPDDIFLKSRVSDETVRPLYIIPRRRWLAQPAIRFEEFDHIPKYVVISHTATEPAPSLVDNVSLVRDIQSFHIESRKWSDIAYSFLIGEDGNVYEGRGWKRAGSHTLGYNHVAIGISFIGCYMMSAPPNRSLHALSLLLELAVKEKYLAANYGLLAHCQCSPVESPGKMLFEILKKHPHWLSNPLPAEALH